jgi:hypothetical protein
MLANLQTWSLRSPGLEFTADILRRLGFHVEAIVLCETSREENEDARSGLAAWATVFDRRGLTQSGEMIHAESKNPNRPGLQRASARASSMLPGLVGIVRGFGSHAVAPVYRDEMTLPFSR